MIKKIVAGILFIVAFLCILIGIYFIVDWLIEAVLAILIGVYVFGSALGLWR